jgi:hypothetical protein
MKIIRIITIMTSISLSLEVVLSQVVVHAPRPDQFRLRVGHEKFAMAALIQVGVDEAQRFGALVDL